VKKILVLGVMAVALLAVSQQRASAWIKCNFSIGLNFSFESGNNCWFWGLFQNGQAPGYPTDVSCHGCCPSAGAYAYSALGFDHGSHAYADYHQAAPSQPQGEQANPPSGRHSDTHTAWYGNRNYQPAGYSYQAPSYPQGYGYQGYGYYGSYGYSQVPSYWYGY
jgi:hypothetical protein